MKKESAVILLAMAIILVATPWIVGIFAPYQEKTVKVLIEEEVEQARQVKEIEDKFSEYEAILLGGGGAGGKGGIGFVCFNASHFIEEVEPGEKIRFDFKLKERYVEVGPLELGYKTNTILEKTYMAGVKDRAIVIIYREEYQYQEGGRTFWIQGYTPKAIMFGRNNTEDIWQWQGIFFVIVLIVGLLSGFIYEEVF